MTDQALREILLDTVESARGREQFFIERCQDVPRNLEFLFSMNRLNVAVSRARCLSVIVCSPELLQAHCRTPEQMRLVNALCLYHEKARVWDAPAAAASLEQPVLPGIDMMRE